MYEGRKLFLFCVVVFIEDIALTANVKFSWLEQRSHTLLICITTGSAGYVCVLKVSSYHFKIRFPG